MKRSGFTLVELLVAIVISTVLAAVAIPKFHANIAKARASEVATVFAAIAKVQHLSYLESDQYQTCETREQFLDLLGLDIGGKKYFTYTTGPTFATLVADIPIEDIPLVHEGFWVNGNVEQNFGKLGGGELVEYLYDNYTQIECAATEDAHLLDYLHHYLFYNVGVRSATPVAISSDDELSDVVAVHIPPKHNHGHGNNYSGYDISNPGNKPTDTTILIDDEMPTGNNK